MGQDSPKQSEITLLVRGGLLDEEYNLNDQVNMIILPMLVLHARALGLPKHRLTPETFHHAAYSRVVRLEVQKIFMPIKEQEAEKHELPDYKASRKQLEALSKDLRERIVAAGKAMKGQTMSGDSLDQIPESHLKGETSASPAKEGIDAPLS